MTVAALPSAITYVENGVTVSFAVPFRFKSQQLIAQRIFANGSISTLIAGPDYSIAGGSTDGGGTLTVTAPAASGTKLWIRRRTPRAQAMAYTTNDRFPAASHEGALDTLMLVAQEVGDQSDDVAARAFVVPPGEVATTLPVAASRAGLFLAFDALGGATASTGTGTDGALRLDLAANGAPLIGVGNSSLADVLDNAPRDLAAGTFRQGNSIDFNSGYRAGEAPIAEVRLVGGATAVIGSNADLEVVSAYTDGSKAAVVPNIQFAEGIARFQVRRGADNANSGFMVRLQASAGDTRALWSSDGTTLSYGLIAADGTVTLLGAGANKFVGAANQLVWIELETPPLFAGLTWRVRSWVDGGSRPSDASAIAAVYGSEVATRRLNEGRLQVSSIGSVPTRLARAQISDGRGGTKFTSQVALVGRWFPRYDGGTLVMATNRGGSRFRFLSTGTNDINISYVATPSGNPVALDVFVNGARYGAPVLLSGAAGTSAIASLLTGLDPLVVSQVEVRVRGVDVFSDMWNRGAACLVEQLVPTITGGRLAPWPDNRPKALFIGDSITAGNVARGTGTTLTNYGGDVSWPSLSADGAGMQPIISAFGGTGLTVGITGGGSSTSPAATEHAFNYMAGRPIDTVAENIKVIVVNLGTNDLSQGVATGTVQTAYIAFLQKLLKAHPGVGKILAMYPFKGAANTDYYRVQIFNAVGTLNDPRIVVVNTALPEWDGITYTDGTHPDVAGHATIASVFTTVLRNALAGAVI